MRQLFSPKNLSAKLKSLKNLPNPFCDARFFHAFLALFALNFVVLLWTHAAVLQFKYDAFFFASFAYRIIMFFVTYIALICIIFWLKVRALQNLLLGALLLASGVCYIVEIFVLYVFATPLNSYFIIIALETNPQESADFLRTYLSLKLFGIYALSAFVVWAIYRLKAPRHFASLKWIYAALFLLAFAIHLAGVRPATPTLRHSDMLYNAHRAINKALKSTLAFMKEYKNLNAKFDALAADLQVQKSSEPIDNIVLIIGESTQRGKLGIYGYALPTTPRLSALKAKEPENLLIFDDVISSQGTTSSSLSQSLTFASQDNGVKNPHEHEHERQHQREHKQWHEYLNIIDAMKLGGYHTTAISNQETISVFGNVAATILARADEAIFINNGDSFDLVKHDGALLPVLDSILTPPPAKSALNSFASHGLS